MQQFLNLVTEYEEGSDTMYNRIVPDLVIPPTATPAWVYQLNPIECGGDGSHRQDRACDIMFSVGVYIPHADLPIVVDRLQRHRLQTPSVA